MYTHVLHVQALLENWWRSSRAQSIHGQPQIARRIVGSPAGRSRWGQTSLPSGDESIQLRQGSRKKRGARSPKEKRHGGSSARKLKNKKKNKKRFFQKFLVCWNLLLRKTCPLAAMIFDSFRVLWSLREKKRGKLFDWTAPFFNWRKESLDNKWRRNRETLSLSLFGGNKEEPSRLGQVRKRITIFVVPCRLVFLYLFSPLFFRFNSHQ